MKVRLVHTAVMCWEISDNCTNKTGYARTYHKGAWAALNDRGAAGKISSIKLEESLGAIAV